MDDGIKQRLIGAVVLVTLMIIFVPMFFSDDDIEPVDILIDIPERPPAPEFDISQPIKPSVQRKAETSVVAETVEVVETPKTVEAPTAVETPKTVEAPTAVETPKTVETPKVVEAPKAVEKPKVVEAPKVVETPKAVAAPKVVETPKAVAAAGNKLEQTLQELVDQEVDNNQLPVSWALQVASFQDLGNAESLRDTLRSSGYKAYIKYRLDVEPQMIRVFVGPVLERVEIDKIKIAIAKQHKLEGVVVRYLP